MQFRQKCIISILFVTTLTGCAQKVVIVESENSTSIPLGTDTAYCNTSPSYSGVTITGMAYFKRRLFTGSGLGIVDSTNYPIRQAEIEVTDSNGNQIQCGETSDTGSFSLDLPADSSSYTIKIFSRSNNSNVIASVQDSPYSAQLYSISTTVLTDSSKSVGNLIAPANGDLTGGAFNILEQILKANEFLKNQTSNCNSSFVGCVPFTVAPKVYAYWSKGVNPATYLNSSSALSYYLVGRSQLFILGGANGDTDFSDTDHFDNSIILHEYGHFIEDHYSKTDSPGGFHDANSIIDPRLAWGEGWATFFALAVSGDPIYRDTKGNITGSTGYFFYENLETRPPTRDVATAGQTGEGNFREFSIVRTLWDTIDPYTVSVSTPYSGADSDSDGVNGSFAELWTIFSGSNYFPFSSRRFRNFGLFMSLHSTLAGSTNTSSLISYEEQKANREDYANEDTTPGGTCTHTIQALSGMGENGTFAKSNQFASNDFYQYTHTGGTINAQLTYSSANPSDPSDLDLYIYKEDYVFGSSDTIIGYSDEFYPSDGGSEAVNVSTPAGTYMINVKVYANEGTGSVGSLATYTLTVNGEQICP